MLKKTCAILLFVMGITTLGLGTFNEARADDPCFNFTITLDSVVRDHGDVFNYNYIVEGNGIPINKISILLFGIDGNLLVIPNENVTVLPPGDGASTDGWLEGIPQLQTLIINAQSYTESNPLIIQVSGSGGNIGDVAAHTKAGNKIETCFVDGPVIGLPVDASVPLQKRVVLTGVNGPEEFCIDIDPRTGCPYPDSTPYNCDTGIPLPLDEGFVLGSGEPGDPEVPTTPTIVYGEGSDPRCPVSKVAHNPCQWVCIGGTCYGAYCW